MSNYKPHNVHVWNDRILTGVLNLMDRRIAEVNAKFPLTLVELQQALIPPATLSLIYTLETEYGVKNIPTYDNVWFTLPEDPRQPRPAIIYCEGRRGVLNLTLLQEPRSGRDHLTFNLYCPPEEKEERMTQLYSWVNSAVTERRHRNLVRETLDKFLKNYADTLWHVMVRWPVLKLGFDYDTRERAQTAPRNPERYGWNRGEPDAYDWFLKNREVMKFIDKLLLEASLLASDVRHERGLHASIQSWKKLGDEAY